MSAVDVGDFTQQRECIYEGESYSVRDNGAVLRHARIGKRARANDNVWTLGKENASNPYMYVANARVHRIVATAFHGAPPGPMYVVDHIDTNCRNNRPENLRWLTRLENALKNPVTRKKIEYLCGSIEAFLENPSKLNDLRGDPNFRWMRQVTPEEARNCMTRMSLWANSKAQSPRQAGTANRQRSFARRVFGPIQKWEAGLGGEPGLELALTPWCAEYMWTPSLHFPCCPQHPGANPLDAYYQNLKVGAVLAHHDEDACQRLIVLESTIQRNKSSILVMCETTDSKWAIVGIEHDVKSKHFIHFYLGSYSSRAEANRAFCVKRELSDFWSDGYANGCDRT